MANPDLATFPIHLGLGGSATVLPKFTGDMAWYNAYGTAHASDGADGRLVTMHSFSESWDTWEVHPKGEEVVVCLEGRITLHQESATGQVTQVTLAPGEYVINPPGVWHTADIEENVTALFITAGEGTEQRPR